MIEITTAKREKATSPQSARLHFVAEFAVKSTACGAHEGREGETHIRWPDLRRHKSQKQTERKLIQLSTPPPSHELSNSSLFNGCSRLHAPTSDARCVKTPKNLLRRLTPYHIQPVSQSQNHKRALANLSAISTFLVGFVTALEGADAVQQILPESAQ